MPVAVGVGTKSQVEHALSKSVTPSLAPVYTPGCATVSPVNLLNWYKTHCPNTHFVADREEGQKIPSAAGATTGNTTSDPTCETRRDIATTTTTSSTSDARGYGTSVSDTGTDKRAPVAKSEPAVDSAAQPAMVCHV